MENQKEKQTHTALKEQAKCLLLDMGFDATEIFEEYEIKINSNKRFIVDVVGIGHERGYRVAPNFGSKKVAIECGHTNAVKVSTLSLFFDEVILLPFNVKIISPELQKEILKKENEIRDLQKTILSLENEVSKLNNEKETLKQSFLKLDNYKSFVKYLVYSLDLKKELAIYNYANSQEYYTELKSKILMEFSQKLDHLYGSTDKINDQTAFIRDGYTLENAINEFIDKIKKEEIKS